MVNVGFTVSKISGTEGQVRMPDVGVLVGWFNSWSLTKKDPRDATYVLKATFGHVNATLWAQDYRKEITVFLNRTPDPAKQIKYQLCGIEAAVLNGTTLECEGVSPCPAEAHEQ